MKFLAKYSVFLILLNWVCLENTFGQKINVPLHECLKNITSYSYTPPNGSSVSNYNWAFGDGSTSNKPSPQYIYKTPGTYLIILQTDFTNNTSRIDSAYIIVHKLPTAILTLSPNSNSCIDKGKICVIDSSTKGVYNQTITKRLIVWGNGDFNTKDTPSFAETICYGYTQAGNYSIKMEITDIYACKNSVFLPVVVLGQSNAKFTLQETFKDCQTKQICLKNKSTGPNISSAKYQWSISNQPIDSNAYINSSKCIDYTSSSIANVTLKVIDQNGCSDEETISFQVKIDNLPSKIELSNDVICYSSAILDTAKTAPSYYDNLQWYIDSIPNKVFIGHIMHFTPKSMKLMPGKHNISINIKRGPCETTLSKDILVVGPVADFSSFISEPCSIFSNRPIYMINESPYNQRKNCSYQWFMNDLNADSCTNNRRNFLDTGFNCNFSTDYFAIHNFNDRKQSYAVKLIVKDTTSSCIDSAYQVIEFNKCCNALDTSQHLEICQGGVIDFSNDPYGPKKISIDHGKTWHKFPYIFHDSMTGTYDAWFSFVTESPRYPVLLSTDSLIIKSDSIVFYDTLFLNDYIIVHPVFKDGITFSEIENCNSVKLKINFNSGQFYKGQKLNILWGDNTSYSLTFKKDSILKEIIHPYWGSGVNKTATVEITNIQNCNYIKSYEVKTGKTISIINFDNFYCSVGNICPEIIISDIKTGKKWIDSRVLQNISWSFDSFSTSVKAIKPCHNFTKSGYNEFYIMYQDSICSDTITKYIFFQDLKAGVKEGSRTIFCNELKQFFDSSTLVPGYDAIVSYNWDFGIGNYNNPTQNPFKSINSNITTMKVRHKVSTSKGCTDEVHFNLDIIGSNPYFQIQDTIACENLDAIFKNLSKNCSGYIWEFGDENGTILPVNDLSDADFSYIKPGRYHIKLYGYDSFYNPSTKHTYFCNNIFPDPQYQRDSIRDVIVLPKLKADIISKDTVCPNSTIKFHSISSFDYHQNEWKVNQTDITRGKSDTIQHIFSTLGKNTISLRPKNKIKDHDICSDISFKDIFVISIKADFELDPIYSSNNKHFLNTSLPISSLYHWNFGDSLSSDNTSFEANPFHTYPYDTGRYSICLIAANSIGCMDTTCKTIFIGETENLQIYNVFTPSLLDNKNDVYDVVIFGESYYKLSIFNRWGQLVYSSLDDEDANNWNGNVNNSGEECPSGTYYYVFEYKFKSKPEEMKSISGTIQLIR